MFDIHRVELDWGGRKLVLETGKIARQADGAVVASYGESKVLATVVAAKEPKTGIDFLPLTCNYFEKTYAAGRIPGGYFKREGRPSERETLTSRMIDRPVRPLFAPGWRCDTQVIVTVLSHDLENDPDILGMVAASAALTLSGAPFMGPIGAARVGFINNEYVLNPQLDEMPESRSRPGGGRHPGRRADGRIGSQGAVRGGDAGSRDVRPPAFPAGDRGHHPAGREGRQGAARARHVRRRGAGEGHARPHRPGSALGLRDRAEDGAPEGGRSRQGQGHGALPARGRREPALYQAAGRLRVQGARIQDRALEHPRHRPAHRRPRREDGAADRLRGRHPAARARLGAVHPRRDAGIGGGDARHRRGRAVHRRAARNLQGDVPPALQLPAVLGRRDRSARLSGPARDRPRQARLARHPSDAAAAPRVPLHHPGGVGDHRVRTARPRWRPCAAPRSP